MKTYRFIDRQRYPFLYPLCIIVDMAAATKADVKVIYLRSYGGSVDFSSLEGYPNPGFSPRIFTVEGHIDESISCFLSDNLLQMRIYDNRKIKDLSFLEKAPHLQKLDLGNLPGDHNTTAFKIATAFRSAYQRVT